MHTHVVEEAGVYIKTVNTSLKIAENGIQTSRYARTLLVDPEVMAESMVDAMLDKADAVKRDVEIITEKFRDIRTSLFAVSGFSLANSASLE